MIRRQLTGVIAAASITVTRGALAVSNCGTDCYQADSCQGAEVQAAVTAAVAASGGRVKIPDPSGASCDWSQPIQVDASKVPLEISGQSADTTHIRASAGAFAVKGAPGVQISLSDLKLSDATCTGNCDSLISVAGADSFRFHHLRFDTTGVFTRLFRSYGKTFGLIDHVVARGSTPSEFLTADDENFAAWKRPLALGSAEAVYVEDCDVAFTDQWEGRPFDGENGGRMVVRHNKVKNQMLGSHGLDSGFGASIFSVVAYANAFVLDDDTPAWSSKTWGRLTHFRGGTGLMYDNTWTVGPDIWIGASMDLAIYRQPGDAGGNEHWQACNGTKYRMCSNIGKDWSLTQGNYPFNCATDQDCVDKIGAGTTCKWKFCSKSKLELCTADGDCPSGETCTAYMDGSGADGYPCYMQIGFATQMERAPWYEWGNTWTGGEGGSACASPPCDADFGEDAPQLEAGRDYYDDVPQGTALPSSCKAFDAYFDTSKKTLYRCDAAGSWQSFYVEYPYPHPLQGGGAAGAGGSGGSGAAGGGAGTGTGGSNAGAGGTNPSGDSGGDDSGCGCASPRTKPSAHWLLLTALVFFSVRRLRAGLPGA
ncbi:MAG: hypothetical protein IT375_02485 [Polyangiaceae bacterium]|nr:hypothetical protein [Polyangiaceae bacterium]